MSKIINVALVIFVTTLITVGIVSVAAARPESMTVTTNQPYTVKDLQPTIQGAYLQGVK